MRAAPWEGPGNDQDQLHGGGDAADSMAAVNPPPNDAMRSWLARGIHTFGVDPRRLGGRGHARRVLGEDRRSAVPTAGAWLELASALQRHTLHNALTRLSAAERHVVTLAYLEGRTNGQIAAALGVSVSTVRRRLWLALEHLDEYVRRTGTWVSSILLLGLVYVIDRSTRLGRFANPAGATDWTHRLVATVAVGAVTAAGISLLATNLHASNTNHASPPATARLIQSLPRSTGSSLPDPLPVDLGTSTPNTAPSQSAITHAAKATMAGPDPNDEETEQGDTASDQSDQADSRPHVVAIKDRSKHTRPSSQ
jgi:hypothetical protein